jgi:oligopeptide transport system substrate-binding protein
VSYFLSLTAMPYYFPVHPPTILKFGAMDERATPWTRPGHIVTNGPFRLKRWQVNSVIEMEKNPTYWNAAANPINGLRFYPIDNASQEERLIRSGQLHVSYEMPIDKIGAYQAAGSPFLRIDPFLETFFLRFNVTNPVMKEKRIRQALARAIDRAQLVREVTRGGQQPATHFVPPDTAGYTCAFQAKTDFDSARKLLAEAGYPGGKGFPAVDLIFNSSDFNRRVLEAIQEMWKRELGISVTISNQEFKVYLDAQRTLNYTLCRARWVGDYADPSTFLEMFITGGGNNQTGWSNTTYDRLIQESQRASTREARYAIYQQAEALLLEECPISPVFFGTRVFLLNPAVKNWKPSLLGFQRYQDIRLEP